MVHMGGQSWYHQISLSPIPSSQGWACVPSARTYIIMYLFFYDVIGVCLIFIFYEFYLFILSYYMCLLISFLVAWWCSMLVIVHEDRYWLQVQLVSPQKRIPYSL